MNLADKKVFKMKSCNEKTFFLKHFVNKDCFCLNKFDNERNPVTKTIEVF